jgi:Trk K+ transport system NAD-binding subunit
MENKHQQENLRLGYLADTEMLEIRLAPGMPSIGMRIQDLNLPPQALITSVRRKDEVIIAHGDTLFQPKDTVVVAAQRGTAEAVRRALCGQE